MCPVEPFHGNAIAGVAEVIEVVLSIELMDVRAVGAQAIPVLSAACRQGHILMNVGTSRSLRHSVRDFRMRHPGVVPQFDRPATVEQMIAAIITADRSGAPDDVVFIEEFCFSRNGQQQVVEFDLIQCG